MGNLSTDAIVTIISTVPGLLVSLLSAWFAYAAIRRRPVARNDIETSTIGFIMMRLDPASLIASSAAPQLPPVPAVQPPQLVFGPPPSQQFHQVLQQ